MPAIGRAVIESSDLSHSWGPVGPSALNTMERPSGDNANELGRAVGGVTISRRISGGSATVRRPMATADAMAIRSSAANHASRSGHAMRPAVRGMSEGL